MRTARRRQGLPIRVRVRSFPLSLVQSLYTHLMSASHIMHMPAHTRDMSIRYHPHKCTKHISAHNSVTHTYTRHVYTRSTCHDLPSNLIANCTSNISIPNNSSCRLHVVSMCCLIWVISLGPLSISRPHAKSRIDSSRLGTKLM